MAVLYVFVCAFGHGLICVVTYLFTFINKVRPREGRGAPGQVKAHGGGRDGFGDSTCTPRCCGCGLHVRLSRAFAHVCGGEFILFVIQNALSRIVGMCMTILATIPTKLGECVSSFESRTRKVFNKICSEKPTTKNREYIHPVT